MERGYTFAKSNTVMFEWKLNDISSCEDKENYKNRVFESVEFSTRSQSKDLWKLELYFNHNCTGNNLDGLTWIFLRNISNAVVTAKVEFLILNSNQEKILINETTTEFSINHRKGTKIFKKKQLLNNKSEFLSHDILTLYVKVTCNDAPVTILHEKSYNLVESRLANDLKNLYENKDNSDVTIMVRDTKFQAHKLILSVRSPVLAAMFTHDLIEKKSNEVFIPDIDPVVFEKVLQFIYTDKIKDSGLDIDCILEAADKYQIQSLKEFCEEELIKSLDRENVIKTVILADRYNVQNLKDYAMKCVIADAVDVIKMKEFDQLEENSPFLALKLLKKIVLENIDNETTIVQIE